MITRRRGFTLIELMVVVSLIGVVAAVVVMRASKTVHRLEYNHYVRRVHAFMAKARAQAIMTNSVQRVVCKNSTQLQRWGQRLRADRSGFDENLAETLMLPARICTVDEVEPTMAGTSATETKAYTFLPDGLGDEFKPLSLDVLQGPALENRLYYNISRDTRGKVVTTGPKKVSERGN